MPATMGISSRVVIALLVLLVAAPILAQEARDDLLQQGIAAYDDLDYEESIRKLSAALLRHQNTTEEQAEIYRYLGLAYLLLDRSEQATGAFRSLLFIDPEYHFDQATAPRIVEFFESVRRRWQAEGGPRPPGQAGAARRPVGLMHVVPPRVRPGRPLHLHVAIDDPDGRGDQLLTLVRPGGRAGFAQVAMPARARVTVVVPADAVRPGTVEYFFEVKDARGEVLVRRGDRRAPFRIAVPDDETAPTGRRSILGRWWFWAGAAVLAGGGVALAVALAGGGDKSPLPDDDAATVLVDVVGAPE